MPFPARGEYVKLGKGSLFFQLYDANGVLDGVDHFVGNANSIELTADVTTAELFSSTEKSGSLIDRRTLRTAYTLTAGINEVTLDNIALFLLGQKLTANQAAVPAAAFSIANAVRGGYYNLGYRNVSGVVVARGSDILTVDVDYTINSNFGMLYLVDNAGAAVVNDGDNIQVDFSAPVANVQKIAIAQEAGKTAKLLFLADDSNNDAKGAHDKLEIWRTSVAPDGALALVGEDYASFNLAFSVLSDGANHPADPFGILERVGASL